VGGTLGVSGISTFTADLVATTASMSFQDDEGITLGTGDDATVKYDGTNVSLDTQAVGSGLLIVTGSEAISGVEIDNTATDGDPTLAFTLSGTSLFTMGVDDGDSDKFKIGTTAIGTSTSLTIDGSQNVGLSTAAPVSLLDVRGPTGTGAASAGLLTLATNELTIVDDDQLGRIDFRSPIATAGTDAIVTAASIWSEANATFSSSVNSADLVFATSTSGAPTERLRIDSDGDVYSVDWYNYFDSSTVVGWSSFTTNRHAIMVKKVGKLVFVNYYIQGTSNSTTTTFTVPYTSAMVGTSFAYMERIGLTYDNTTYMDPGSLELVGNTTLVYLWMGNPATTPWTASGSKIVAGQFWYQEA
jgi:hypothetical protein